MSDIEIASEIAAEDPKVLNGEVKNNDLFETVLNPPNWLNQKYLENALRDYMHDKALSITECSIVPATKPGDNFASVVFRAQITFTSTKNSVSDEEVSYIIKVKPFLEGVKKDMMGDIPFFDTEIKMYTTVLPEMQRLLSQTGDKDIIAPKIIHHGLNPDIIMFEDIGKNGYVLNHTALSYENTQKLLIKLAKFHALSYYIQKEEILDLSEFNCGLFSSCIASKFEILQQSFNNFIEAINEYEEYREIINKLAALKPYFMKKLNAIYKPNPDGFNVLNHGDFHLRNLLFRFVDDELDHISFIDFQISIWATPAIDLYYALYAATSSDVRDRQHELLRRYHDEFSLLLSNLGYLKKVPSLLDLHIELLQYGFIEIFMAACFLPMQYMDLGALAAEATDEQTEGFDVMLLVMKKVFKQEPLKEILSKLLPKFLNTGILEIS